MDDSPGLSDEYRMASPWPVFVAFGLAISEVGVVLGLIPVAVGGLLLFVGSVAGIVREAGYVARPWGVLGGLGVVLVLLGAVVVVSQVQPLGVQGFVDTVVGAFGERPDGIVIRGVSIATAGLIAALAAGGAAVMEKGQSATPA